MQPAVLARGQSEWRCTPATARLTSKAPRNQGELGTRCSRESNSKVAEKQKILMHSALAKLQSFRGQGDLESDPAENEAFRIFPGKKKVSFVYAPM